MNTKKTVDLKDVEIPRMMSIPQVVETGILTRSAVRAGIRDGWIPHIKIGKKYLINFDKLLEIMKNC